MNGPCLGCGAVLKGRARFCNVCGVPAEEPLEETRSGIAAFEMGEYLESLAWFEKALKKRPKSPLCLRDTGHALFHLQRSEKAWKRYEEALDAHPGMLDVNFNLGLLHMKQGRIQEALERLREALQVLHPIVEGRYYIGLFHAGETLELQCRLNIGLLLRQQGNLEEAIGQFKAVQKDHPRNVTVLGNLGDCYLALERYEEAIRLYRQVLKSLPDGPDRLNILNDLGVAYHRHGRIPKAVEQFKAVLRRDPSHENAIHNLGQIYVTEGGAGLMKADFEEFARTSRSPGELFSSLSRSMVEAASAQKTSPAAAATLLVGDSGPMREVKELIRRAAASDATVLILGENGTGKELVARSIHQLSGRFDRPFMPIACSALSESLLESELFGHERGSFTGAVAQRIGRFEAADRGTVFLDEIGELSQAVQVKLLRFLQEREFERVGGTETQRVDVRVVAATNRDLKRAVQEGRFREDLFYRLNVITIEMPPLRSREGDLEVLAAHFLSEMAKKRPHRFGKVAQEALALMRRYRWPGNVRELENVIERVVTLYDDVRILPEHLPQELSEAEREAPPAGIAADVAGGYALESAEREIILRVLREARFNKKKAALKLGISRPTLYQKIRKYGLSPEQIVV